MNEADAKKLIQEQRDARQKENEEAPVGKGKPTPTQDELDLHMLGVALEKHEDDGSGPSPHYVMRREAPPERVGQSPQQAQPPRPAARSSTAP
jgi:hypothetical protein